ncbi:MAG: MBL fold metallo-hydrolase [Chloroflexota bacterium]
MNYHYQFQLGQFTCTALYDNSRVTSPAQLFPTIPEADLQQAMRDCGVTADEVQAGYNCLHIDTDEHSVLIDTGSGAGHLHESLQAAGIDVDSIDTVIITHGDGDHIGGINGFPNARFVMTPQAWHLWTDPTERHGMVAEFVKLFQGKLPKGQLTERAVNREAYGSETLPALQFRVELVEPETAFIPGFKLVAAPGHRRDHTAVEIQSQGDNGLETLLHVVDGIRHPVQVANPRWASFIDSYPEQTADTNVKLLERAIQNNALIFGAHLSFPALGHVRVTADGIEWSPVSAPIK